MNRLLRAIATLSLAATVTAEANAQSFSCISAKSELYPEHQLSDERLKVTVTNHCTNLTIRVAACVQRKDGSWSSGSMTLMPTESDTHDAYNPLTEMSYNVIWRSDRKWPKTEDCRNSAAEPIGSGPPIMHVSAFELAMSMRSFKGGLYKCPGDAPGAFHFNQTKPGQFNMTNGDKSYRINASQVLKGSGDDIAVAHQVFGLVESGVANVCAGAKLPPSWREDAYKTVANWLIEMAEQCEKDGRPSKECADYRQRAVAIGVRG